MSVPLGTVLAPALVCLLSAGIGVPIVAAQLRLGPPAPFTSTMPDTSTAARPFARSAPPKASVTAGPSGGQESTLPNLSPQDDWPSPVNDEAHHLFTLFDVLEYRPQTAGGSSTSDYRWDVEGWYGGDYNRVWFKSEGQRGTPLKTG